MNSLGGQLRTMEGFESAYRSDTKEFMYIHLPRVAPLEAFF